MSYSHGTILHIENFRFRDGVEKDTGKFIIVLTDFDDNTLIISITTSQDHVPSYIEKKRCIHEKSIRFHVYIFPKDKKICDNDFSFPKETYIYLTGSHVQEYDISRLETEFKDGKVKNLGTLKKDELLELIYCVYCSPMIKNKFKPVLESLIEQLTSPS